MRVLFLSFELLAFGLDNNVAASSIDAELGRCLFAVPADQARLSLGASAASVCGSFGLHFEHRLMPLDRLSQRQLLNACLDLVEKRFQTWCFVT